MRRLVVNAALLLAAALVLAALRWTTPGYDVLTGPLPAEAKAGDLAQGRSFTLRTGRIQFAKSLSFKSFGKTRERGTAGLWAVVETTIEARLVTMSIATAYWEGPGGVRYAQSERVDGAPGLFAGRKLQPGLPQHGIFVFEITPEQARGVTLVFSQFLEARLDSEIRIDLPASSEMLEPAAAVDLDDFFR